MAKKFWGEVLGGGTKAVLFPFAVGKGVYNVANGREFGKGFDDVYNASKETINEIEGFGDKHSDSINGSLKTVGLTVVSIVIANKVNNKGQGSTK